MSDIIDFRRDNLADVPAFFTGSGASKLVPSVFPVAIDGRPYMIDQKSKQFVRGFEPRIRDSVDQGVEPGEATINPQGLWRRNQTSWHFGAGQVYGDVDSAPYRFFKSKGVNPWTKGQLTLLNGTKVSLSSANTNLLMCVVESGGTEYLYVADNGVLRFSSNPFDATPTWTAVTTGSPTTLPTTAITGLETNGTNVFIAWTGEDIWYTTPGSTTATFFYPTSGTDNQTYSAFGFAKGRGFAAVDQDLYQIGLGSGSHTIFFDNPDTSFRWVGAAAGQNAVYAAGRSGDKSLVYKITIKADGTLDVPVVALELPIGERVSAIHGYLGFILIGSNKGVRFCSTDNDSNLIAGSVIPTSGKVNGFTSEGRFVWYTYSNYDGVSTGLGRMDLSVFTSPNTPAYATDLMYTSTANVLSCATIGSKRVFSVSGVGVVVEDETVKVASGQIETGKFRWGIMDPKFVVKVDARTEPLVGSLEFQTSLDGNAYVSNGTTSTALDIQHTFEGSEIKMVEAGFKIILNRSSSSTGNGPTLTRITARAYATPTRSEYFKVPVLLHNKIDMWGRTYYFDVMAERSELRELVQHPRVIKYQEGDEVISVIVEDIEWQAEDARDRKWEWDGTAIITMRSIQE
jgi:hypothetical protein